MKNKKIVFATCIVFLLVAIGCEMPTTKKEPEKTANEKLAAVSSLITIGAVPSSNFATTGLCSVSFIPLDGSSAPVLSSDVIVEARATVSSQSVVLAIENAPAVKAPSSTAPWGVAINIDSSTSMDWNDSNRLRVTAAKAFTKLIIQNNASSELAIYDFGAGYNTGFQYTRLLQTYTTNNTLLDAGIDKCVASGLTPMYNSLYEVLGDLHTKKAASSYQRSILVLTDGEDNSRIRTLATTTALAKQYGIPINVVALGGGYNKVNLQTLARETNGVYGYAPDASKLNDIFSSIAIGSTKGYLLVNLVFPQGSIPRTSTTITLTVKSGGAEQSTQLTLVP